MLYFAPVIFIRGFHTSSKERNLSLDLATDPRKENELSSSMVIGNHLRFGKRADFSEITDFEEVISNRSRCHSRNLFREVVDNYFEVENHVI